MPMVLSLARRAVNARQRLSIVNSCGHFLGGSITEHLRLQMVSMLVVLLDQLDVYLSRELLGFLYT